MLLRLMPGGRRLDGVDVSLEAIQAEFGRAMRLQVATPLMGGDAGPLRIL
jgi:hypothetical protein